MAALATFCALLLILSALHKAQARPRLTGTVGQLTGTGPVGAGLLLLIAGVIELFAGLALLVAPLRLVGAVAAVALWSGYALALARRHGTALDCGCDLAARTRPVTLATILRPVLLAAAAGLVALLPATAFTLETPFAAAGLLALYLGASELLAIPRPHWRHA